MMQIENCWHFSGEVERAFTVQSWEGSLGTKKLSAVRVAWGNRQDGRTGHSQRIKEEPKSAQELGAGVGGKGNVVHQHGRAVNDDGQGWVRIAVGSGQGGGRCGRQARWLPGASQAGLPPQFDNLLLGQPPAQWPRAACSFVENGVSHEFLQHVIIYIYIFHLQHTCGIQYIFRECVEMCANVI